MFTYFFLLLQANSYTVSSVTAPSWLHRFIIGKKGQNLAKITQQMPKVIRVLLSREKNNCKSIVDLIFLYFQVHIEFTEGEDKITLEGPTKDVQMVQTQIETIVADLASEHYKPKELY